MLLPCSAINSEQSEPNIGGFAAAACSRCWRSTDRAGEQADNDKPEKRKAPGGFPPEADLKPLSSLWDEPDQKLR
jgi:hypothetical protein